MALVYTPIGLLKAHYEDDISNDAVIVTLMSGTEPPIYVPDTYIESYPNMGNIQYSWMIASVSLGPLPSAFDLTLLKANVASVVADTIGIVAQVNVGVAELTEVVSLETHKQLEATRKGHISISNTDRSRALAAEATNVAQALHIQTLEAYIIQLKSQIP